MAESRFSLFSFWWFNADLDEGMTMPCVTVSLRHPLKSLGLQTEDSGPHYVTPICLFLSVSHKLTLLLPLNVPSRFPLKAERFVVLA